MPVISEQTQSVSPTLADSYVDTSVTDTDDNLTSDGFKQVIPRQVGRSAGLRPRQEIATPASSGCSKDTTGPVCSASACSTTPVTVRGNASAPWPTGKWYDSDTCISACPTTATGATPHNSSCGSSLVPASWKPAGLSVAKGSPKAKNVTLSAGSLTCLSDNSNRPRRKYHVPRKGMKSAFKPARRVNPNLESDLETLKANETHYNQIVLDDDDPDATSDTMVTYVDKPPGPGRKPRVFKHARGKPPKFCWQGRNRRAGPDVRSGSVKIPAKRLTTAYGGWTSD